MQSEISDIFVIGGGVNGCGIARDAAGRGLSVTLAEKGDLASGTSSASTKLFHGGLRYLEYFEIRLVREALKEREVLLTNMPHIAWPLRFVLPLSAQMRFESETPVSRLLARLMPWLQGRRPDWLIRLGLFAYDHMGGRKLLPPTERLDLRHVNEGAELKPEFAHAFEYSDVWVDDARLVALNARDAAERGAQILTRCEITSARRINGLWEIVAGGQTYRARALVNAGGPWVAQLLDGAVQARMRGAIRLVRGSHIVVPRLFKHEKAYFFQGPDGRIIFAIPYERDYTLIGTTDAEHSGPDMPAECTGEERAYLLDFINGYLKHELRVEDVVWSYAGVRPLQDDGQASASAATRDYELRLEEGDAPLLTVFGGKITTYRKLSEAACERLAPFFPALGRAWTRAAPLAGGGFAPQEQMQLVRDLEAEFGFLAEDTALRLIRAYGLEARDMLAGAKSLADLGAHFGAELTAREVDWLCEKEFAQTAEDILWRRSKLGLRFDAEQISALEAYLATR